MVKVESCCGCKNAETGTLIIAWLGLVLGIICCLGSSFALLNEDAFMEQLREENQRVYATYEQPWTKNYSLDVEMAYVPAALRYLLGFSFITSISSLLLIFGVAKRNDVLFYPWLIEFGILVGLSIPSAIAALTRLNLIAFLLILGFLVIGLSLLWLIVHKCFQEIKKGLQNIPIHEPGVRYQPMPYALQCQPQVQQYQPPALRSLSANVIRI